MKKIVRLTESDLTRIVRRVMNEMESDESYDGSRWYDKMKEYEEYLSDVRKKSQEHRELCDTCVWNGFNDNYNNTADLRSIVYFDNIDENEVQEILNKIDEIAEYTKRGHDPAWQISMNKRLRKLKHLMLSWRKDAESDFHRRYYGRQLQYFDQDKGESFPYKFNK